MNRIYISPKRLSRLSKRYAKEFDVKLSVARESIAKMAGYRNLHELSMADKNLPEYFSSLPQRRSAEIIFLVNYMTRPIETSQPERLTSKSPAVRSPEILRKLASLPETRVVVATGRIGTGVNFLLYSLCSHLQQQPVQMAWLSSIRNADDGRRAMDMLNDHQEEVQKIVTSIPSNNSDIEDVITRMHRLGFTPQTNGLLVIQTKVVSSLDVNGNRMLKQKIDFLYGYNNKMIGKENV